MNAQTATRTLRGTRTTDPRPTMHRAAWRGRLRFRIGALGVFEDETGHIATFTAEDLDADDWIVTIEGVEHR